MLSSSDPVLRHLSVVGGFLAAARAYRLLLAGKLVPGFSLLAFGLVCIVLGMLGPDAVASVLLRL